MKGQAEERLVPGLLLAAALSTSPSPALAVDPPVQIAQYAHTSWTSRDEYPLGAVFAMAQTPDGYLWLASQRGVARFDGEKFTIWQPPEGQRLPNFPSTILAARDGTLWIGTWSGLASWDGTRVTAYHGSTEAFRLDAFPGTAGGVFVG